MHIFTLEQLKKRIDLPQILSLQEQGFNLYSKGLTNIPLPGLLQYKNPTSSYHIKYGHIEGDEFWVIKIAGGPEHLPINGMMMAINTMTGETAYILQDQGYLTSLRTAVAGLIAAKYLANKDIKAIGIIGTGVQARMQLEMLQYVTDCKKVYVWGRSEDKLSQYKKDMSAKGFDITLTKDASYLAKNCQLTVTTTGSRIPIIKAADVQPGTHITAIGADSPQKIELEPALISRCDVLVVDSKAPCTDHGEVSHAFKNKLVEEEKLIELGEVINDPTLGRKNAHQITIADLTGLAVQDIQIVKAILNYKLPERNNDTNHEK